MILALAGCTGAPIGSDRAIPGLVAVGDQRFAIYRDGFEAAAFRRGPGRVVALAEIEAAGARAIEWATGCPVADGSLRSDHAIVRAALDCDGAPARLPEIVLDLVLDCALFDPPFGSAQDLAEIDCAIYSE